MFKFGLLLQFLVLMMYVITGCSKVPQWHQAEGAVWNTMYHITYASPRDMSDSIQQIFREIELSLSPFNEQSIVARINHGEDVAVDDDFAAVFMLSKEVSGKTGGMFDPTVSPVINLWKFGYTGKVDNEAIWEPSKAEIDSALALVGILECNLLADKRIQLKSDGTTFNFSAITKGYACDRIAAMLKRNGATGGMVEIGGEIALFGNNPQGEGWRIQIDLPQVETSAPQHEQLAVLQLTDCAVATSGNYRNYHQTTTGPVGHTISPLTGRPVMGEVLSATVVAPTCAEADAYATAAMALGSVEEAGRMLRSNGLRGILVSASPDGKYITTNIE